MKWGDRRRDRIRPERVEGEAGSVLLVQDPAAAPQVIPDVNVNILQTHCPAVLSTLEQRFTAACWTFYQHAEVFIRRLGERLVS